MTGNSVRSDRPKSQLPLSALVNIKYLLLLHSGKGEEPEMYFTCKIQMVVKPKNHILYLTDIVKNSIIATPSAPQEVQSRHASTQFMHVFTPYYQIVPVFLGSVVRGPFLVRCRAAVGLRNNSDC